MKISSAVVQRTKELIKEKGLTKYGFERKANINHDTLKSLIKGKTANVTLKTLVKLASGFDMTVSEFLDNELFNKENLDI